MTWVGDPRLAADAEAAWYLEAAFTPGARLGTVYDDPSTPVVVTGVAEVATLRVPSGRIVVDAPWDDDDARMYECGLPTRPPRELAVGIPPGTYPVEVAWTAGPYAFLGRRFDGVECAATRLRVSDEPVAGWEAGLGVADDIARLQPGERPRVAAGANVVCFADAGAWTTLSAPFRTYVDGSPVPRDTERLSHEGERVSDEARRADLVTFAAESGGVVWLGRTGTGDVSVIVVTSGMAGAKA
ncbi:DUF4241 domain-containing protein [Streptomyces sp. NPDC058052]|uniref:DUF4241 domain-containing protein n=1 Tax=Streptomyces sp. NPDC058052 TaxID=3346316 RepID=UPI0036F16411